MWGFSIYKYMTSDELKQLIREAIQELKIDDGVALQFMSDTGKIKRTDYPDDTQGLLKYYADSDKIVVDFDFSQTRLDDLIVFDNKPVKIEKVSLPKSEEEFISDRESGVDIPKKIGNPSADLRLNTFVPYKFKSINDIADDYHFSKSKISNVYYDRPKLISNLKNYLRRAIKNMASTSEVTLSSENISQIREMVKNGVARFDNESGAKISDFDVIIKVSDLNAMKHNFQTNEFYFVFNSIASLSARLLPDLQVLPINEAAKTIQILYKGHDPQLCHDVTLAVSNASISAIVLLLFSILIIFF